ncbi:hypothetical protein DFH94DRAFT_403233 [Russula ochroleuca]|uniref:DUF6534 domain-containing protein n=1 Tax=Russula ochroleuca TaxID=152965 RepID=A0A9P5MY36_9AGAM|nr:hypothetical protein DFH94DRAFT_403233 [Russula ochroleuca]
MILAPHLFPPNSTSGDVDTYSRREILLLVVPILFGTLVNWLLLGVLTMQAYVCYICFPRDHWWIKFSAYGLYLVELGQTVLVTDIAWVELCAGWGIISALSKNDWGFSMTPLASGLIACWVQIFFAWRVWTLGHNTFWKSVAVIILVISFAQGCAAVIFGVELNTMRDFNTSSSPAKLVHIHDLFFFYLTGSAVADFLIAASMLYFLISTRRKPVWNKETNRRITKLIRSTFETGALCSAVAILDLVVYLRDGRNCVHISILMVLSKLYSNALMASLNSRAGCIYERPTMSDPREESLTTSGHFNTAQFTSIGVPVTTGEFECVQRSESERVNAGRPRASNIAIALTNLGSV